MKRLNNTSIAAQNIFNYQQMWVHTGIELIHEGGIRPIRKQPPVWTNRFLYDCLSIEQNLIQGNHLRSIGNILHNLLELVDNMKLKMMPQTVTAFHLNGVTVVLKSST